MNCQGQDELITLYAVGALEGAERDALRSHLATGCPRCAGLLAEAEATWALIGLGALEGSVELPAAAKAALDSRIEGSADGIGLTERDGLRLPGAPDPFRLGPGGQLVRSAPAGGGRRWGSLLLAACLGIGLTAAAAYLTLGTELNRTRTQVDGLLSEVSAVRGSKQLADEELKALAEERDALATRLSDTEGKLATTETQLREMSSQLAQLLEEREISKDLITALRTDLAATQKVAEMLYSKQLLTLDLAGQNPTPEARARLLVDLQNKVWKLYATDLKPLNGRVYEFWLITEDGTKVPMGSFTVDADGKGTLTGEVPDPLPALAAAAVSDEPGPGAKQPTGTIHVIGQFR